MAGIETEITAGLIRDLLRDQHPDLAELPLREVEGGWGNQDRMERLVNAIRKSNAIQKSMREAEDFIKRALDKLSPLHPGIERSALEDLARYIIDRRM